MYANGRPDQGALWIVDGGHILTVEHDIQLSEVRHQAGTPERQGGVLVGLVLLVKNIALGKYNIRFSAR
jgi:hypothetical protein